MSLWCACVGVVFFFKIYFFIKIFIKKNTKIPQNQVIWCLWMDKLNNDNFQNNTAWINWYSFLFHCPFYNRSDASVHKDFCKIPAVIHHLTFKMQISLDELLILYCPNTKLNTKIRTKYDRWSWLFKYKFFCYPSSHDQSVWSLMTVFFRKDRELVTNTPGF